MFEWYYDSRNLKGILVPQKDFHPFPVCGEELPITEEQKNEWIARGEAILGKEWPIIRARDYMRYYREGCSEYLEPYYARRDGLGTLMLAELAEQKGRFLNDLIDLLWAMLEESTWENSAQNIKLTKHYNQWGTMYRNGGLMPLADVENLSQLCLTGAITAAQISVLYHLFKPQLDAVTPLISRRIELEMEKKLFDRFLAGYYWWSGLEQPALNWDPWIVSNVLTATAFVCHDEEKRAQIVSRCCFLLERFLLSYHSDGGCDEGPNYWSAAGGALINCLDILSDLTGGKCEELFREPLVKNIAAYVYRAHLNGVYYTNYADSGHKLRQSSAMIYRCGKRNGDAAMVAFGAALDRMYRENPEWRAGDSWSHPYQLMKNQLIRKELEQAEGDFPALESVWLDGIQLIVERQEQGDNKSLILSAKAGHNDEAHNHNDVGSFLLYLDGEPVICDIGPGTYTADTFNENRYKLRQMQSSYHNVPEMNGVAQQVGREFAASEVEYSKENGVTVFSQNLAGAYPAESGATRWMRRFTYDRRNQEILLQDSAEFVAEENRVELTFITPEEPTVQDGFVLLCPKRERAVKLCFAPELKAVVERVEFPENPGLNAGWNGAVYRLRLVGTVGKTYCTTICMKEEKRNV